VLELLGPSAGGIRLHVAELTRRLPEFDVEPIVAGPAGVMDGLGVDQHVVAVPSMHDVVGLVRARRRFRALCAETGVDVVHVHGLKAAMVALAVADRLPVVLTVHNLVAGTQPTPVRQVLQRVETWIVAHVDHLVVISDEIDRRFADVVPCDRRTFVLPVSPPRRAMRTSAEVRAAHGVPADAPLVTIVARHHRQKNLPMFLEAFAHVRSRVVDARALMVGDGPEREALERRRSELGLTDAVTMLTVCSNPADEMCAADVVALSSDWEGSPLVVAECLSLGRPLVSTDVGTVRRHLVDGVSARITPVGDAVAFADAIADLLEHPERAAALAAAGHSVASTTFDPDALTAAVAGVYRRVAPKGR
jgi:glycosyltransferase involved in cell wall biosynthesis